MKKVLALVLALVMVMGMALAASAENINLLCVVVGALACALYLFFTIRNRAVRKRSGLETDSLVKTVITSVIIVAVVMFFTMRLAQYKGLPMALIWVAVVVLIYTYITSKTTVGRYLYAIGGNENAAEVSGVNTTRTLMRIYTTAGIMYAIAGYLLAAKSGGASASMGQGYELEAIAGCTIGGVSTTGGIGTVPGILIGVLVFELLKIILQFLGVNPYYNYVVQGLVIVLAVSLDIRKYIAKK